MFFFWKSKSFLEKSIKTSFIKRKLYYKKIREGKELNEKNLSKNWKQFALTDEIKTDMKDLMKQAAEKTKLMVKTAEAQSNTIPTLKERKMYKRLSRFENEKLSMKKPNILNKSEFKPTCHEIDELLHRNVNIRKKVWNRKTKQYNLQQ